MSSVPCPIELGIVNERAIINFSAESVNPDKVGVSLRKLERLLQQRSTIVCIGPNCYQVCANYYSKNQTICQMFNKQLEENEILKLKLYI